LIEEAGVADAVGIQFDVWHLWDSEGLEDDIAAEIDRIAGVHVNDVREPTRSFADRVLPGDGVADVPRILAALDRAGWDGFYDLEIFSDNGAFGNAFPDSLWDDTPDELARRGLDACVSCWKQSESA
jgi:sugar phosphate isomerase/epimerase